MWSPRPCGDRVAGVDDPEALALAGLAPLEVAGGAHQALEDLGEVAGVEDDQAHAVEDPLLDAIDDLVVDLAVGLVAPPEEDVGASARRSAQAVLGLVEGGGPQASMPAVARPSAAAMAPWMPSG